MKRIEEQLSPEMEGMIYEHIWITTIGNQYTVCKDFYTVSNGMVFMINDGIKQLSGDSLEDIKNQCLCIGNYNPATVYKRKILYYSKEEFKKLLKLD